MKKCFKCQQEKSIEEYYRHPRMKDGHLNKCIQCAKNDNKFGKEKRNCWICGNLFYTNITEIKRGGGLVCSRNCYYERLRKIVKKGEESHSWKGDKVSRGALHNWVELHLGKPKKCEKCGDTVKGKYDWANISRQYKRNLKDWVRLCRKCHIIFDGSKTQKNLKRLSYKKFMSLTLESHQVNKTPPI